MHPLIHLGTLSLLIYAWKQSYRVTFAQPSPKSLSSWAPRKTLFLNRFQCEIRYTLQGSGRKKNRDSSLNILHGPQQE